MGCKLKRERLREKKKKKKKRELLFIILSSPYYILFTIIIKIRVLQLQGEIFTNIVCLLISLKTAKSLLALLVSPSYIFSSFSHFFCFVDVDVISSQPEVYFVQLVKECKPD